MRTLLNQLRVRLILGSLLFLLGLTCAVILVVRDSLLFAARNTTQASTLALVEQQRAALLEITRREAELGNHAIHHDPADLGPLVQRLQAFPFTPGGFAVVLDTDGNLVVSAPSGVAVPVSENSDLQDTVQKMRAGETGASQVQLGNQTVLVAYAPLEDMGWSLAVFAPLADVAAGLEPLSARIQAEANGILETTLITIGYFAVIAIIGAVIAARALTGPIQALVQGTRSIIDGDLSVRIPVKSSDELGLLAASFNQMVEELQARNAELLQANQRLSEREARLSLITEVTTDALYEWDIVAGKTEWSHSYRTLFGYPAEGSHKHMWWRERVHPEDLEPAVERLEAALQQKDEFISFEYRYRRADGTYAHVVDRGYFFYDETGRPLRMVGAMIDISDRVTLSEAQAQAALEERQRLARELHDSVTQSLYSLTLLAEASHRTARAGDIEKVATNIARLGETAQQALKEMRLLVYELRPLALEQSGLADALQYRLDAVEKRAGVDTNLRVELDIELPAEIENALYRVAQETLNNALKHAEASKVSIFLRSNEQEVAIEIVDNGKGFDTGQAPRHGGLGLVSIGERIEALQGKWSITSKPGEGTRVTVNVPLRPRAG
jgi:PAS domain S-box-containing protein